MICEKNMIMMMEPSNLLTDEQLNEFETNGVLVIENVFNEDEVSDIRDQFHNQLMNFYGINHEKILANQQAITHGHRIKGDASNIFYNKWKLNVTLHHTVYSYLHNVLTKTFGIKKSGFEHPYDKFTDVLHYIDRVCYRLPDHIRAEGGLSMHIDRNPTDPYLAKNGGLKKWRPIQALLTLTDHYGSESGGLKVVKGFHKITDEYFKGKTFEGGGEFCRLTSKSHSLLEKKLEPLQAPKGSLIIWDNRIPHSTCDKLISDDTREVIYVGYLPDIELNKLYCKQQLSHIKQNIYPPAYINSDKVYADKNWSENEIDPLIKKLLLF